jgi:hypothetical protein
MKKILGELVRLKPLRVLAVAVMLLAMLNHVAGKYEFAHWQPDFHNDAVNIYAYQHAEINYDVLFIGSSRIKQGILSPTVERELRELSGDEMRVFNLGQRGSHVLTNYFVLRDALGEDKRPRVVVVELSVAMLNSRSRDKESALKYYASQGDLLRLLPSFRNAREASAGLFGAFRGLNSCLNMLFKSPRRPDRERLLAEILANGGGRLYKPDENPYLTVASRSEEKLKAMRNKPNYRRNRLRDYRIEGPSDWAMKRMVALSKQRGFDLIFVNAPVTDEFMGIFENGEYVAYMDYMERFSRESGIEFYDLNADEVGLTRHDFSNLDHLNRGGAEKLSRYLPERILNHCVAASGGETQPESIIPRT